MEGYPKRFIYAFARIEQAVQELAGKGTIEDRVHAAAKALAPIAPRDLPEPLRAEFAVITEGLADPARVSPDEEGAVDLAKRIFALYLNAVDCRHGE
jgi:hypothetical protein